MNAQIYNIMLEDSENIAGFFRDQPGGEMCLALFLDICRALLEKDNTEALPCVIETIYTICEIPKRWDGGTEGWNEIFIGIMETQIL